MNQAYRSDNQAFLSTKDNNVYLLDGNYIVKIQSWDSTFCRDRDASCGAKIN